MQKDQVKRFLIIGAGSWGTALALLLARNGQAVEIWGHSSAHNLAMSNDQCNERFMPGVPFPDNLQASQNLIKSLQQCDYVLIAVPSHAFAETLQMLKPDWPKQASLLWATKGLDPKTGQFLHQIARSILGDDIAMAMITGPSFAKEVVQQQPTAVVLASENLSLAQQLQVYFHNHYFRTYLCDDLLGAEIGGAVKNILAIAVGIADGLQYGSNTRSALMTRGLAEMMRLGIALGAKKDTFMGLSGLGDLILTCTDNQSRNRRFGVSLGQGKSAEQAINSIGQVVEGIQTTETIYRLAQYYQLDLPIINQMYRVLYLHAHAADAVQALLARSAGFEQ